MKRQKSLLSVVLILVFLCSLASFVFAENWYYVPNLTVVKQAKTQWCWAASGEMAGKCFYTTSTRNQWSGVLSVRGSYVNEPGYSTEVAMVAEHVSYNRKDFIADRNVWAMSSIRRDIMNYGYPLVFLGGYYNSSGYRTGGHFVVGDAVYQYSDWMRYRDPWDATTHWCTYQAFRNGSYNGRRYEETVYCR